MPATMTPEEFQAKEASLVSQQMQYFDAKLMDVKADKKAHGFHGYAATWELDQTNDVIIRGAFAETIRERGPREDRRSDIKVLWQHNQDLPIGLPTMLREDDPGLYVEATLAQTFWGKEAFELIAGDLPVVDKLSIGYRVVKHEYDSETGIFYLKTLKLYEFSPVTFPANMAAIITGAKNSTAMVAAGMIGVDVKTIDALHVLQEILKSGANIEDLKKALALAVVNPPASVPETKGSDGPAALAGWLSEAAAEIRLLNERR